MRYMWVLIVLVVGLAGCGQPAFKRESKQSASAGQSIDVVSARDWNDALAPQDGQGVPAMQKRMQAGKNNPPGAPPAAQVARKLIMTGSIALLVDRLDQAEQQLQRLLTEQGGYIAQSQVTGSPGSPRQGSWTLRVPADHFQALREAVLGLGEMRENKVDSSDITDQYYDLNARIKTKQQEETRLLELLKKSTGNLKDILAVEEHLTQVRGDIEQMQGQLQRWDKQTALSTLIVVLYDRKDYVPPTAPAFGTSIGRTFSGSVDNLVAFCQGVVLVLVALGPWLPLLAVVMVALGWFWRRGRRRAITPPVGTVS